jgi:hypothetical protein
MEWIMDNLEIKIMGGFLMRTKIKTILMDSIILRIKQTKVPKACSIKDNLPILKCHSLWPIKAIKEDLGDRWALWELEAYSIMIIWVHLGQVELPMKCSIII